MLTMGTIFHVCPDEEYDLEYLEYMLVHYGAIPFSAMCSPSARSHFPERLFFYLTPCDLERDGACGRVKEIVGGERLLCSSPYGMESRKFDAKAILIGDIDISVYDAGIRARTQRISCDDLENILEEFIESIRKRSFGSENEK